MAKKSRNFAEMRMEHLRCRSLGHGWDPYITFALEQTGWYEIHFRCRVCKSERVDALSIDGVLDGRDYHHVDKYLISGLDSWGGRKVFNQNVRGELVMRLSKGAKKKPEAQ